MIAATYDRPGPAREVFALREVPDPRPGPGEVRIAMELSGVNPSDWRARTEQSVSAPEHGAPWRIPHSDGVGIIDGIGEGVPAARLGRRVWTWNAAWRRRYGTAAQYVCLPSMYAVDLPPDTSARLAAGLGIPFMTAWHCLNTDGGVNGRTVLVTGGAGAVGNATIQLAKFLGAQVVATVSSSEKAEIALAAGADLVVDYRADTAAEAIRAHCPDGVDVVVDVALGANLDLDLATMRPGAVIVSYAPELTDPVLPTRRLLFSHAAIRFLLVYTMPLANHLAAIDGITRALGRDALKPLPTRAFPLSDIAAAHEYVEQGRLGKVVVELPTVERG